MQERGGKEEGTRETDARARGEEEGDGKYVAAANDGEEGIRDGDRRT